MRLPYPNNLPNSKSGIAPTALVLFVAILVVVGLFIYLAQRGSTPERGGSVKEESSETKHMMEDGAMMKDEKMMEGMTENDKMMDESGIMKTTKGWQGKILAGTSAPLIEFNKTDYDRARQSDKLIFLYFYATWCPICRVEVPRMHEAFNELSTDKVIGFQVNYKDTDTDRDEQTLAREQNVTYQHTKIFLKPSSAKPERFLDSWDKARYLREITSRI